MATAPSKTSRKAKPSKKVLEERRKTAEMLLDLETKLAPAIKIASGLEAKLKQFATDAGDSFKEDFGEKGYVSASGAVAAEYKGEVPEIQTEAWLALPKGEKAKLIKSGLIALVKQYGKASNGRVTVKVL